MNHPVVRPYYARSGRTLVEEGLRGCRVEQSYMDGGSGCVGEDDWLGGAIPVNGGIHGLEHLDCFFISAPL